AVARRFVRRRVLLVAFAAGLIVVGGPIVSDRSADWLGSYAVTTEHVRFDLDLIWLAAEHVAILALGLAIVPFLLGVAWLVDRVRPSACLAEQALGVVGCTTIVVLTVEVASFDQRFGAGQVKDRYFFYIVPVVLVGLAGACSADRSPRWWSFLVPALPVAAGFATVSLVAYEKLNVDSPLAMLNGDLLRIATSLHWAHVLLVLATLVAVQLLVLGATFLPRRALAVGVATLVTVALPAEAMYAFDRLFAVNGTNGLPITLDQGGVFGWLDRAVGPEGRVTMIRYPVNSPDWWAGTAYWWDVEFWNESAVEWFDLQADAGLEPWVQRFNRRTGEDLRPNETEFALVHGADVRFRLAGEQVYFDRGAFIFKPDRPWRAAWLTGGIYADGWTRPHTPAAITVYAEPNQVKPLERFLTVEMTGPDDPDGRPYSVSSNLARRQGRIATEAVARELVPVCVPPGGSAQVVVETPIVSDIYRDPTESALTGETDRPAGILLRSIALADERVRRSERCPPPPSLR
ncbi:MAG TPA: hypothetical protein VM049_06045, partial [Gaiellaceae bacterium]|nr:hypothetical protein [Gaiellaceae bacterium]